MKTTSGYGPKINLIGLFDEEMKLAFQSPSAVISIRNHIFLYKILEDLG